MEKIFELEYEGRITPEQGYKLRELLKEGFDVSVALEGRVSGIRRCNEMGRLVRQGDTDGIRALIKLTEDEEKAEAEKIREYLESRKEN